VYMQGEEEESPVAVKCNTKSVVISFST